MNGEKENKSNLSLYFMEDNPVEAILIKDSRSDSVLMNQVFRKMFSLHDVKVLNDALNFIVENDNDYKQLNERIHSLDNSLSDKPVKIISKGRSYHFYVYYHSDYELVIIHARDMSDLEKLTSQLDDYARGLVQNIFDLEISQRKLLKSRNRLHKQLKASTDLGLTTYESYKNTKAIFRIFTEIACSTLDVERCGIWLLEENGDKLRCRDLFLSSSSQHIADITFNGRINPEIMKIIKNERLLKIEDINSNSSALELSEIYLKPNGINSILIATVVLKGKIAGCVSFEHIGNTRIWEDDECGFSIIFADHVARILSDVEKNILESQLIQTQKMETIGTLVGGLAHDFNNLLGGIVGSLSLLRHNYKHIDEEGLIKYIEIMENASGRATDLVKQLLAVASKQDLTLAPVDLNIATSHIIKIAKNTFDKSVDIKYHSFTSPAITKADPIQIEQVLLNLCINACHAMTVMRDDDEKQGGTLTIGISKINADDEFRQIHPEAHNNDFWSVSIEDTGIGMDKKTSERIFEPFFTTKKSSKIKGTGLGLTMVYNIIHDHSGFIDVQSEPGKGTIFNVYLPVLDQEYIEENGKTEKRIMKGEGVILVVDDEELMRTTTKSILEVSGYKVILAENGEQGLEIFKKQHNEITAVILDMSMPKKSGRDTFYEMLKIDPSVKVLLATGYMHDERSEEILRYGVKGFIQKPYSVYELSEALYRVTRE
ncbi:MAG TPA: response regulator [Spirochaetota bacterium]|nr:response regulator [Spirochaetota bacterium]HRX47601.1 response regulator [Spirochaetota bacterium]